ncbi:HEPN domain-containing protein [Spirosoma fluviale]|uniref:HEPN domain-containing protein n=1 Tax=Spirosoma fluviale TaxID=1597977 RepID=A0A286F964_9BACT|nr:HEPN domain-containing protein [Spirosoma fluviale]SOD79765.1 HEPN domain-containing protein [Spirosoma fluviale]
MLKMPLTMLIIYIRTDGRISALANRAYYAIFYCICALLATEGIATKKHQAARAKFSEFFVKTGRFDVQASKIVGNSFAACQSADYDMEAFLSEAEAELLLEDSRAFYEQTIAYFAQNPVS